MKDGSPATMGKDAPAVFGQVPIRLVSLVCERDVDLAIECLGSFASYCSHEFQLMLFEDGSLSEAGAARLSEAFPSAEVIRRRELDERAVELLRDRPHCRRHREVNATMLKVLDIPARLSGHPFLFCDSDVLFLRPFSLAGYLTHAPQRFVFMQDRKEAYSGRIYHFAINHRLPMPSRLNSGVMSIPPGRYDPDFVEWFLAQEDFCAFPQVVEQSAWAGMTRNRDVLYFDPGQIVCAGPATRRTAQTVAIHFPSHFKAQLPHFRSAATSAESAVSLRLVKPRPLGLRAVLVNALRNRFGAS